MKKINRWILLNALKEIFGKYWYLWIFLLITILLLPVFIFNDKIYFDEAQFTNIWISIWLEGIFIYLILKIIIKRKEMQNEKQLMTNCISLTKESISSLLNNINLLKVNHSDPERKSYLLKEWRNFRKLYIDLNNNLVRSYSENIFEIDLNKLESFFMAIISIEQHKERFPEENETFFNTLENFRHFLETLNK